MEKINYQIISNPALRKLLVLIFLLTNFNYGSVQALSETADDNKNNDKNNLYLDAVLAGLFQEGGDSVEDFIVDGRISSEHILLPSSSGHGVGMIEVMNAGEISTRSVLSHVLISGPGNEVVRSSLDNLGFAEPEQANYLNAIKHIAHGDWVDNYLDNTRKGSQGTTLIIKDNQGQVVGFLIAIHSDLLGTGGQILSGTLVEESVQGAVYDSFFERFFLEESFFPTASEVEQGLSTEQIILDELTQGNLRAFLEFLQHSAINSANSGWLFFPYDIQVGPNGESTKNITRVSQDFDQLLQQTSAQLPGVNFPTSTADFLSRFDDLEELNELFFQVHQVNIWDYFGMAREGLRVFPLQEYVQRREINLVSPDHSIRENYHNHEPTFPRVPFEQMTPGTEIYIQSIAENEVFVKSNETEYQHIPNLVTEGRVFRAKIIGDGYAEVLPDNGLYQPYGDGYQQIFIDLEHYQAIYDYEPITMFESTRNQDKQIIVLQTAHPEVLLVEGDQIIMRVPAVLGADGTETPIGDHRLFRTRPSRHMPGQPGVGFASYIGGGNALHESPWWNWENIDRGFYGSHGCMNLPSDHWGTIGSGEHEISIPHFVQRWVSTNVSLDVTAEEEGFTAWNDPGYNEGITAVRLLVVSSIDDLRAYRNQGSGDFNQIIQSYYNLGENWVLPDFY